MKYSPIAECASFWSWFYFEWDFPYGWRGPYTKLRRVGFRLLGWEIEWTEARTGDD